MYNVNFSNIKDIKINKDYYNNYVTRYDGIINYCGCLNFLCNYIKYIYINYM